jgi:hypothetical protein
VRVAELWARLLANAMDPKLNNVRHQFIEIVTMMDPLDAITLNYLYENKKSVVMRNGDNQYTIILTDLSNKLGKGSDDVEVSLDHLLQMRLFKQVQNNNSDWHLQPLAREFLRACYPEVTR